MSPFIHYTTDAEDVVSLMLSVELAIAFNPGKDKNQLVRKVCTHARHRMRGNLKTIVNGWRTKPNAYQLYDNMMTKAGL